MYIKIEKSLLSGAIARVQGAVAEKSLGQIALRTKSGGLQIMAADRVLAIYCELECETKQEGEAFIPAKFFADVVRELPQGQVSLQKTSSSLVVTAGKDSEFTIKLPLKEGVSWQECPSLSSSSQATYLPCSKIAYMIEQVQFCLVQDSTRSYGAVGYLHKADAETLRLVGTDGFRLSYCDVSFQFPEGFLPKGVCVSKRALAELTRMCHEGFEQMKIFISEDQTTLCAQVDGYQIFILLSAVKFPQYQGVIPKTQPSEVEISRSTLQSVSKRVLLAAGKTKALKMLFSKHRLTLSSKNLGNSEGRETMSLKEYSGGECSFAVNGKFLSEIFATTVSDDLQIQFKNNEDPLVIVPAQEPKGCRSRHILVPIRESE